MWLTYIKVPFLAISFLSALSISSAQMDFPIPFEVANFRARAGSTKDPNAHAYYKFDIKVSPDEPFIFCEVWAWTDKGRRTVKRLPPTHRKECSDPKVSFGINRQWEGLYMIDLIRGNMWLKVWWDSQDLGPIEGTYKIDKMDIDTYPELHQAHVHELYTGMDNFTVSNMVWPVKQPTRCEEAECGKILPNQFNKPPGSADSHRFPGESY
ncbi:hypothetical protein NKR23_g264 [Pleurostoma richardsiae]|uniref:Uncharacterized protein n=1 Tax=Pleurostoma richardsiae TaxID=41990 RepID=A0AA38VXU2_9PEZI|nr:hypothetical protein NKR23_g264 [Pleurostoma richardsiae]